ncbi:hypothetical protein LGQ02_14550 [Bacillus shivajii]|uniref:ATP-binding protein n=1 Tax=Bacillus shivajii TaxID=1983719 RepID=UPI001CF9AA16|nr:ATP-binding protein [Bacillus shivajii]UCZ52060.1 hypothetical protein LGQ02_14550 [Bacillus shivajii]
METFLQVLLNLFFLLTPIFLYITFWKGLHYHHHRSLTKYFFLILCIATLVLTMLFPIQIEIMQIVLPLDFQHIVIFIATFIGGITFGFMVIIVQAVTNFLLYGANVMVLGLLFGLMIVCGAYLLSQSYYQLTKTKRKLITLAIFLAPISIVMFYPNHPFTMLSRLELFITGITYLLALGFITLLILFLIERIQMSEKLEQDLQKSEQLRLVSELAASVAHEVRNPMTVARGFIQLIHSSPKLSKDEKKYLQLTMSELDRAQSIISDYLSLAKPKDKVYEPVSVYYVMDKVRHTIQAYALMNNVSVYRDVPPHLKVKADERELTQVLLNLAKNGIEAMENGGSLILSATQKRSRVILRVKDTGCGMTNDQLKQLGTAYYSTKEKGTGLGLMITYNIIHSWGGQVSVQSKVNEGTEFMIELPIAHEQKTLTKQTPSQSL